MTSRTLAFHEISRLGYVRKWRSARACIYKVVEKFHYENIMILEKVFIDAFSRDTLFFNNNQ